MTLVASGPAFSRAASLVASAAASREENMEVKTLRRSSLTSRQAPDLLNAVGLRRPVRPASAIRVAANPVQGQPQVLGQAADRVAVLWKRIAIARSDYDGPYHCVTVG